MKQHVYMVRDWYGKYERPISSVSLILGFVFDAVVLKRVDMFWENFWVIGHIVIVALCMILIHKIKSIAGDEADPMKVHFWLVNITQFFFGGLLSVFLVFYFRSSDLSVSWLFILILGLAFWANESLKRQFVRMTFQVSLLFLSVFLASIFQVPIIIHQIGREAFIFSGLISLLVMSVFLFILEKVSKETFTKSKKSIFFSIAAIFIGMNILYFTNIIPPIPLSLKDYGIYHSIEKNDNGDYVVSFENIGWRAYFKISDDIHIIPGETVYAYSAIFSPTSLNIPIVHEWQYYDNVRNSWVSLSSVTLPLIGGREGGFRTYSGRSVLQAGKWRVNVLTQSGQVIGRLRFNVLISNTSPVLQTKMLI